MKIHKFGPLSIIGKIGRIIFKLKTCFNKESNYERDNVATIKLQDILI